MFGTGAVEGIGTGGNFWLGTGREVGWGCGRGRPGTRIYLQLPVNNRYITPASTTPLTTAAVIFQTL